MNTPHITMVRVLSQLHIKFRYRTDILIIERHPEPLHLVHNPDLIL